VFIAGCVVFFSLNVLGDIYFNFRIFPATRSPAARTRHDLHHGGRLMLRWLWGRPGIDLRAVVLVFILIAASGHHRLHPPRLHMFPALARLPGIASSNRITDWLWKKMPDARGLSFRVRAAFWTYAWHDFRAKRRLGPGLLTASWLPPNGKTQPGS